MVVLPPQWLLVLLQNTGSSSTVASGTSNNIEEIEGTTTTPIIKGIDHDKLQDKAVIAEEEVEEQQQQEMAENTTLNQASAAAWDPAIRNQLTPHKDDKHWHNDCRQGRFCILQDAYPTKQYGGRGRKRAVQKSWLESYGWLEWSQEENPLFCYPCWIFNSKRDNEWCCRIDAARCCKQHVSAVLKTAHELGQKGLCEVSCAWQMTVTLRSLKPLTTLPHSLGREGKRCDPLSN